MARIAFAMDVPLAWKRFRHLTKGGVTLEYAAGTPAECQGFCSTGDRFLVLMVSSYAWSVARYRNLVPSSRHRPADTRKETLQRVGLTAGPMINSPPANKTLLARNAARNVPPPDSKCTQIRLIGGISARGTYFADGFCPVCTTILNRCHAVQGTESIVNRIRSE